MRSGSFYNPKRSIMAANSFSSSRKRHYGTMLLLALGAAVLCVVALHKMRERRVYSTLLQDRDHQVLAMQLLLETERQNLNEMKRKMVGLKMKMSSLATQKSELHKQLMEAEAKAAYADEIQREKETAIAEKQTEIDVLTAKEAQFDKSNLRISTLTELLKQKEAEIDELRQRLVNQNSSTSFQNSEQRGPKLQETQLEKPKRMAAANGTIGETTDSTPDQEMNGEENDGSQKGQWVKLTTNADNTDMKDGIENDNEQFENVEQMSNEKHNTSLNGSNGLEVSAETKGQETDMRNRHETRSRRRRRRKRSVAKDTEEKKNEENVNKEHSQIVQAGGVVDRESVFIGELEDKNEATPANNNSPNGDISKEKVEQKQTDVDVSSDNIQKAENTSKEEISNNLQEHSFRFSNGDTEKGVKSEETDLQNKASEDEKKVSNVTDRNNTNTLEDSSTGSADAASESDEEAAKDTATDHNSEI